MVIKLFIQVYILTIFCFFNMEDHRIVKNGMVVLHLGSMFSRKSEEIPYLITEQHFASCVVCGKPVSYSQRLINGKPATFWTKINSSERSKKWRKKCWQSRHEL